MSNETEKKSLISKLEKISLAYAKVSNIKNLMDTYEPEDNYERKVVVPKFPLDKVINEGERELWVTGIDHSTEIAPFAVKSVYEKLFKPELETPKCVESIDTEEKAFRKKVWIVFVGGFFGFCALPAAFYNLKADTFTAFLNIIILIVCAGGIAYYFSGLKKAKAKDQAAFNIARQEYQQELERRKSKYNSELKQYESDFQDFVEKYSEWREAYIKRENEELSIKNQLDADRAKVVDEIYNEKYLPAKAELEEINDLISDDYLPVIRQIIDLLISNRADNLKDAINLYEEIVYKERQLKLIREQEQLRREDEERRHREDLELRERQEKQRRYDEEKHHREQMEFLESQERQRQEENRRRENEQRAEEERRRRHEDREELDRKMEADRAKFRQCNTCALASHCSVAFTRPNCASYRPR